MTKLTTPDMEVYTTDSGMAATKVLQALEQSEWFFKTASGFEFTAERPLKVLALKSVEEYAPFRLNRSAFAHYIRAQKRDYIVLQDIRPEHLHAAIHEYTHYVMKSLGFSLPIWLNEGLADFYSSILIQGQDVIVGGILPERLMTLDRQSPLDLKTLVAADQGSPILNDPATVRVFYAESWALTHMLVQGDHYAPGFRSFLDLLNSGVAAQEALRRAFGRDIDQIASDLIEYVRRGRFSTVKCTAPAPFQAPAYQESTITEQEGDLLFAEVLAAHPLTAAGARAVLANLSDDASRMSEAQELLGYLDWQERRFEIARTHFASAVALGSKDPDVLYLYAELQQKAGIPDHQVIALLKRVVSEKPDNDEARFNLGVLEFNQGQYEAAGDTLTRLRTIKPDWSYTLYTMLAFCALQDHQMAEAHRLGEQARQFSRTAKEKVEADRFLDYLGGVAAPAAGN